jgi:hypothetical protein
MRWPAVALATTVILLLVADFLAFHDLFEPHNVKDWLILAASAVAVISLVGQSRGPMRATGRDR